MTVGRLPQESPAYAKIRDELQAAEGAQLPGFSVFERDANGALHHFYSQSADLGPDGFRGMDLLNPLWHFFDALPEERGDFMPSKSYD